MTEISEWVNQFDEECFKLIYENCDQIIDACHVAQNCFYLKKDDYGLDYKTALQKYLNEIDSIEDYYENLNDYIGITSNGFHVFFNGFI